MFWSVGHQIRNHGASLSPSRRSLSKWPCWWHGLRTCKTLHATCKSVLLIIQRRLTIFKWRNRFIYRNADVRNISDGYLRILVSICISSILHAKSWLYSLNSEIISIATKPCDTALESLQHSTAIPRTARPWNFEIGKFFFQLNGLWYNIKHAIYI